jgi:hypothetical protein
MFLEKTPPSENGEKVVNDLLGSPLQPAGRLKTSCHITMRLKQRVLYASDGKLQVSHKALQETFSAEIYFDKAPQYRPSRRRRFMAGKYAGSIFTRH